MRSYVTFECEDVKSQVHILPPEKSMDEVITREEIEKESKKFRKILEDAGVTNIEETKELVKNFLNMKIMDVCENIALICINYHVDGTILVKAVKSYKKHIISEAELINFIKEALSC